MFTLISSLGTVSSVGAVDPHRLLARMRIPARHRGHLPDCTRGRPELPSTYQGHTRGEISIGVDGAVARSDHHERLAPRPRAERDVPATRAADCDEQPVLVLRARRELPAPTPFGQRDDQGAGPVLGVGRVLGSPTVHARRECPDVRAVRGRDHVEWLWLRLEGVTGPWSSRSAGLAGQLTALVGGGGRTTAAHQGEGHHSEDGR